MAFVAATRTELRPHFDRAIAGKGGHLVHRVRRMSAYWRDGEISGIYVTWACGRTAFGEPIPAEVDLTCCACLRAEGRHP